MLFYQKPDRHRLTAMLSPQNPLPFNYAGESLLPRRGQGYSYRKDHHLLQIGTGRQQFHCAKDALTSWQMFNLGWVQLYAPQGPPRLHSDVAVILRICGLWSVNPCRIIETIDQETRYGFTYRTLKGHAAAGEEQFCISLDSQKRVIFEITAISRPHHWTAWLAYPLMRQLQKRFGREALETFHNTVMATSAADHYLDCA